MADDYMAREAQSSHSWTSISTSLFQAEMERRQADEAKPLCGSNKIETYNTSAHVFALILILVLSTIACGFPLVSRRASKRTGPNVFVFYSQHFGTGVLMATAFVHLLPTAFTSLTDPCLAWFWSKGYKPMAGLIAMTSALIVVAIEMLLRTRGAGHSHAHLETWHEVPSGEEQSQELMNGVAKSIQLQRQTRLDRDHRPSNLRLADIDESDGMLNGASPLPESTPLGTGTTNVDAKFHDDDNDGDRDSDLNLDLDELDPVHIQDRSVDVEISIPTPLDPKEEQKRLLIQCLLLEAGILFHSVFIGMAVSVATGPAFVVFLIAIACHQSFEGLALGSRIAAINFPRSSPRPWLMVLAYGTTTPIGQAIGLVVHRMYDPMSEAGLLMVGIMNAISSGLLLFAGLVQLLAEDFLTDKSYTTLKGQRRWKAFASVVCGAALMALVGAWA